MAAEVPEKRNFGRLSFADHAFLTGALSR